MNSSRLHFMDKHGDLPKTNPGVLPYNPFETLNCSTRSGYTNCAALDPVSEHSVPAGPSSHIRETTGTVNAAHPLLLRDASTRPTRVFWQLVA
jgi:hypothetical protein